MRKEEMKELSALRRIECPESHEYTPGSDETEPKEEKDFLHCFW